MAISREKTLCNSKKYPYPDKEGSSVLDPHHPGIAVIFQLGWVPPGKKIPVENAHALYFM